MKSLNMSIQPSVYLMKQAVKLIRGTYEKGIKLTQKAMEQLEKMIDRVTGIEKWAVDIPGY